MQPEMQSSELNVSVLLSVGAHPKTARSRRADQDAKALELALSLPKARVAAIHAGDAGDEALRPGRRCHRPWSSIPSRRTRAPQRHVRREDLSRRVTSRA